VTFAIRKGGKYAYVLADAPIPEEVEEEEEEQEEEDDADPSVPDDDDDDVDDDDDTAKETTGYLMGVMVVGLSVLALGL
jgi:hypothetical protein